MSPESICLGRLVTNLDDPTQGYYHHDSLSRLSPSTDFSVTAEEDCIHTDPSTQGSWSWLRTLLSRLGLGDKRSKNPTAIAKRVCTYTLHNSDRKFEDLIEEDEVRRWLEHARNRGCYVYMVVGYQTAISAIRHGEESFGEGGDGATETKAQAESDENAPSNASTTPKSEPVLKGEQIYALQYRKVVFKPLFSMDVRIASLQQRTRWRVIWKE